MSLSTSSFARVTDQSVGALVRMRFSVCCYRSARSASAQWVLEAWTVQWSREPYREPYKEYYRMPPGIAKSAARATASPRPRPDGHEATGRGGQNPGAGRRALAPAVLSSYT